MVVIDPQPGLVQLLAAVARLHDAADPADADRRLVEVAVRLLRPDAVLRERASERAGGRADGTERALAGGAADGAQREARAGVVARGVGRIVLRVPSDPCWSLVLVRARPPFSPGDERLAALLAGQLGAVFDHARLRERLRERLQPHPIPADLTPREGEVLRLIAEGLGDADIARRLDIRPRTVGKHVEHILAKLGVASRTAAAASISA